MKCIYCNQEIKKISKEHIIHNAFGGLLESTNICCSNCNNRIQKLVDDDFTNLFAPITGRILDLKKTNKSNSPSYFGKAIYKGEKYNVIIKNNRVVDCIELKKKEKRNICKDEYREFRIIEYDFDLESKYKSVKDGIIKIAMNYAIEKGIDKELLIEKLSTEIKDDELNKIEFFQTVIPFYPLNDFDYFLEISSHIHLYHNLILFDIDNKLWCYVDLFSTFQFYVLLSEKWNNQGIYESYLQRIEIFDRVVPNVISSDEGYVEMLSKIYKVDKTKCRDELKVKLNNKIQKAPYESSLEEMLMIKRTYLEASLPIQFQKDYEKDLSFYFEDDDTLKANIFRKFSPDIIMNSVSVIYPGEINDYYDDSLDYRDKYNTLKLDVLNEYLRLKNF